MFGRLVITVFGYFSKPIVFLCSRTRASMDEIIRVTSWWRRACYMYMRAQWSRLTRLFCNSKNRARTDFFLIMRTNLVRNADFGLPAWKAYCIPDCWSCCSLSYCDMTSSRIETIRKRTIAHNSIERTIGPPIQARGIEPSTFLRETFAKHRNKTPDKKY